MTAARQVATLLALALDVPEIGTRAESDPQRPDRVWVSVADGSMFRLDVTLVAHASAHAHERTCA